MSYQLDFDWNDFLQNYWQKKPVVIKQAFKQFVDPITSDELAGLAMENEIESRLITQHNGHWQASYGPFEHFDHLGDANWTLLVQAVNHWHQPSAALVEPFSCLPAWRFDDLMISFSVPGGGVGPHIDHYDVFIIQGMGKRRWRVGDALPLKQFCSHPALLHVEPFDAIIDEELTAGDILYIPPGFPHDGYAIESSMSYSVGFRAPNSRDLISGFADYVLEHDLGSTYYRDPSLSLPKDTSVVKPDEVAGLRHLLLELINQPEHFEKWLGEFLSSPRHELDIAPPEPSYQPDEIYDLLRQGEILHRLNGLRIIRIGELCYVNGEPVISSHQQAIQVLSQQKQISYESLADALENESFRQLLTDLINSGYWYFID